MVLLLQLFLFSNIYGQIDQSVDNELSKILKDDDKSSFLTNQSGQDFLENFGDTNKLKLSKNNILIKSGTTVVLEGSPLPEYSVILVEGTLEIINTGDSSLRVQKIVVAPNGHLIIGSEKHPIKKESSLEIVFINKKGGEIGIFVFGKLWVHGQDIGQSFVELGLDARAGDNRLVAKEDISKWNKSGSKIIITSPKNKDCNEEAEISNRDGIHILLKNPLRCNHSGWGLDEDKSVVSHIALLDRNVKFTSDGESNKGIVKFFHGSYGYIKYANFDKLGTKNVLGGYPIHFHRMKDTSRGIEVIGNSITNSDNRWVTIHDSNGVFVKNNVGYRSIGHGFFLEDGNEFDNVFEKNIGIETRQGELIKSDSQSAVFWSMNPMNTYRGNVAVNGQWWGFSFEIPDREVYVPKYHQNLNLRSLPSLEFDDNVVYDYRVGGVKIRRPMIPEEVIGSSEIVISNLRVMSSFLGYINEGIRVYGSNVTISDSILINNKIGIRLWADNCKVTNVIIKVDNQKKFRPLLSGILIAGKDNLIENSEIKGYISKNKDVVSDISISNDPKIMGILSAKIINTTLLDPLPLYFGKPANENSFLEIYSYDAPHASTKKLPENFILKKIGSDVIEERGEYNNLDFMAMIKILHKTSPHDRDTAKKETQEEEYERTKSEIIRSFKNNAFAWKQNIQTNEEFLEQIEILFKSRLMDISDIDPNTFSDYDFIIPKWMKSLVVFWFEDSISNEEFMMAIKFILESQLGGNRSSYY